jgi:hypothetical protein
MTKKLKPRDEYGLRVPFAGQRQDIWGPSDGLFTVAENQYLLWGKKKIDS